MEDAQRWSVMYTKHVRQKRKVYQDGFLELPSSRNKVMLYDEWDKILESRFVKKDDVIRSGESLSFGSYLVDIGELCGRQKPTSTANCQEKETKVSEKPGPLYSYSNQNKRPTFGKSKVQVINLSPSQKIIRDFKKSEMIKCVSPPICVDTIRTSTTEWQVLYTTHITQKAKKFHDGFLQLVVRGSQGRQVKLYDINKRHLDSRFLKKDEIVRSGESLPFEGYLVEIGEEEGDHKPVTDSILEVKNCNVIGKTDVADHQAKIPINKKFSAGKYPDKTSPKKLTTLGDSSPKIENDQLSCSRPANEPRRAVHDILSILKQPVQRNVVKMDKLIKVKVEDSLESHSSHVSSDIKGHTMEYAEDFSESSLDELTEKASDRYRKIKILKTEDVEVLVAAEKCTVSGYERESSSFYPGSGIANFIDPILNVECTNHNKLMSSPSFLEHHTMETTASDSVGQKQIESATLSRSNETEKPENSPIDIHINSPNAAAANGLSSSKLPKVSENNIESSSRCLDTASSPNAVASDDCKSHDLDKTLEQGFHTNERDEFPSFDLGF
ncbi:hypothetical protein ABFS82_05G067400 [Erythranthe guttata]